MLNNNITIFYDFINTQIRFSVIVLFVLSSFILFSSYVSAELLPEKSSLQQSIKSDDKIKANDMPDQIDIEQGNVQQNLSVSKENNTKVLYAEQWELARSGDSILSLPILNDVVNSWLSDKTKAYKIEIQYPGGEEGELWVQQLSDWLVSLGIPSSTLLKTPGSSANDVIKFDINR